MCAATVALTPLEFVPVPTVTTAVSVSSAVVVAEPTKTLPKLASRLSPASSTMSMALSAASSKLSATMVPATRAVEMICGNCSGFSPPISERVGAVSSVSRSGPVKALPSTDTMSESLSANPVEPTTRDTFDEIDTSPDA